MSEMNQETIMKAYPGDRIVIAPRAAGGVVRDGEILQVRGPGRSAPYLVRWSDDGHEALYFPGSDARIVSSVGEATDFEPVPRAEARQVRSWTVTIDLFDDGAVTSAHAVLHSQAPQHLDARSSTARRPDDPEVPEIGDEIAAARALRHLADRLLGSAADDIEAIAGHAVTLRAT